MLGAFVASSLAAGTLELSPAVTEAEAGSAAAGAVGAGSSAGGVTPAQPAKTRLVKRMIAKTINRRDLFTSSPPNRF